MVYFSQVIHSFYVNYIYEMSVSKYITDEILVNTITQERVVECL